MTTLPKTDKTYLSAMKQYSGMKDTAQAIRWALSFTTKAIKKGVLPNDVFVPVRVLKPIEDLLMQTENGAIYPNIQDIQDAMKKVNMDTSMLQFGPFLER